MKRGNIEKLAISAVVVALCLVASFIWYGQDGDPEYQEFRDPVVGDSFTFMVTQTDDDGSYNYMVTMKIVGEDDDGNQTVEFAYNDGSVVIQELEGVLWVDAQLSEPVGQETVYSPLYGKEVLCDVYLEGDHLTYIAAGTDAYIGQVQETDGMTMTAILVDATVLSDEPPEFSVSETRESVKAGDYYAYVIESYVDDELEGSFTDMRYIFDVEGDEVTYGWLSEGREMARTYPVSEVLDQHSYDTSLGTGRYVVESHAYGTKLCTLIVTPSEDVTKYAYIGLDDGVCYLFEYVYDDSMTYRFTLIGSSLVSGGAHGLTGEVRKGEVAEVITIVSTYEFPDGTVSIATVQYYTNTSGGEPCYELFIDGRYVGTIQWDVGFDIEGEGWTQTGRETLSTAYGDLTCTIHERTLDDGSRILVWVGDDVDFVFRTVTEYADGSVGRYEVLRATVLESQPWGADAGLLVEHVVAGDTATYDGWIYMDDVTLPAQMAIEIVSVDGDDVTLTMNGQEYPFTLDQYLHPFSGLGELSYSMVLQTLHGYRVCDVYTYEGGGATMMYAIGADDGIIYAFEIDDGDMIISVSLTYSSQVF